MDPKELLTKDEGGIAVDATQYKRRGQGKETDKYY